MTTVSQCCLVLMNFHLLILMLQGAAAFSAVSLLALGKENPEEINCTLALFSGYLRVHIITVLNFFMTGVYFRPVYELINSTECELMSFYVVSVM